MDKKIKNFNTNQLVEYMIVHGSVLDKKWCTGGNRIDFVCLSEIIC